MRERCGTPYPASVLRAGESFAGRADSISQARRFAESTLDAWQLEELVWTATVLVSELATNAVLHARSGFTVTLEQLGPEEVRLEVQDGSPRAPSLRRFSDEATTGRGLQLLDKLATEWGTTTHADGKTVWVVCRVPVESAGGRQLSEDADALDSVINLFDDEVGEPLPESPTVRRSAA